MRQQGGWGPFCVLSFDCDFPRDIEALPELVDLLDRYGVKASFACIGQWITAYPDEHRHLVAAGHELINHTQTHPNLYHPGYDYARAPGLSRDYFNRIGAEARRGEIEACHATFAEVLGVEPVGYRSPHFGTLHVDDVYPVLAQLGYRFSSSLAAGLNVLQGRPFQVADGLWDVYNDFHMGITGELVSEKYDVTREAQDTFAARSHEKAVAAIQAGKFQDEIVDIEIPQRKGDPKIFNTDEGPRVGVTPESMGTLKAVFKKDGTVTPGNASSINDGASALVVMSASKAKEKGIEPLAKITGYATGGLAPEWVMMAPQVAINNLTDKTGLSVGDFDLIEINEAFSVAAVALTREMKLNPEKVNVNGGAVALGHPIGCSGARILTTLLYAMKDRGAKTGLAALCLGGGNAVALSVEAI